MKWWVFILLPFYLLAQDTYTTCDDLSHNYQVNYDIDKQYYWSITAGDITLDNGNSITILWPDSAGIYTILVWTEKNGCLGDTSKYKVEILKCPNSIYFPNAFTPNGDGINEVYTVKGSLAKDIEHCIIYNRWGDKIIEAKNNIQWDGGNYKSGLYIINVFVDNNRYIRNIMLIR